MIDMEHRFPRKQELRTYNKDETQRKLVPTQAHELWATGIRNWRLALEAGTQTEAAASKIVRRSRLDMTNPDSSIHISQWVQRHALHPPRRMARGVWDAPLI